MGGCFARFRLEKITALSRHKQQRRRRPQTSRPSPLGHLRNRGVATRKPRHWPGVTVKNSGLWRAQSCRCWRWPIRRSCRMSFISVTSISREPDKFGCRRCSRLGNCAGCHVGDDRPGKEAPRLHSVEHVHQLIFVRCLRGGARIRIGGLSLGRGTEQQARHQRLHGNRAVCERRRRRVSQLSDRR
jgi:hypothetical protein